MFVLHLKNGQVTNPESYLDFLLNLKDGSYVIKEYKRTRTTDQNSYLWAIYKIIAESIGEDSDYVHGVMGMKFLLDKSKKSPYIKSTAKLNTVEFTEYIENIKNFVSEHSIVIPSPEEYENLLNSK